MKIQHLTYRIHFANGECLIKHYYSDKQAHGHSWVLASQRATKCTRVELINNANHTTNGNASISIISLK